MLLYLIIVTLILLYYISTRKYNYFKNKKVPHLKPTFLLGNYGDVILQKKSLAEVVQDICKQFPDEPFIGAYYGTEPILIPIDPEIIKLIMTKDFHYFHGRELSEHNHKEPASLNLFATYGDSWKVLRQNMTPLFSSAKMKNMFHLIQSCSYTYESMLDKEIAISKELEVRTLTAKYTIECIAACAFGIDANTMTDDPETNAFAKLASSFTKSPKILFYVRLLRTLWPSIYYALGLRILSKQINFFQNLITSVMERRDYKSSGRNDFVDLVLSWKLNNQIVGDSIKSIKTGEVHKVTLTADDDLLVAQCFVFFVAGFETSSTTLSYTIYELAKHPEIQNRVLEEVDNYLNQHNNKLLYECNTSLPYLEAVIDETLRLYPVVGLNIREQMEDYTFPNEEFRPERFLGEAKKTINPYVYMPFGEGPRACIGMRFAKMQMMAGLITMLKKYRFELADGTPSKLQFKPESFVTHPVGGIKLKFIERDGWEKRVFVQ
ncbi:unnamed protein product [Arctia plantaginis]|uniref:unspecific monooxygenase n=1 Tax=Arctia plantaginis TaxID=874455 RepID=A0A8S1BHG9_ARCPL|nr:unnamed protein product [Arctia plantaginis]